MDILSMLRARIVGPEPDLARTWQAQVAENITREARAERMLFEQTLDTVPGPGRVVLGRAHRLDGTPFWVGMLIEQLLSMHGWVTGATGSGKTFFVLTLLMQVLAAAAYPILLVDFKGEMASLLLDVIVPVLVQTRNGRRLLDNLRVVRPFDHDFTPELRITLPEPGVDRGVQAYMIADALVEGLGADLGARMSRICHRLVSLAVERNEPLTVVQTWLERPELFSRAARASRDPMIRQYASGAFFRENRSSLDALLARLDEFLFLPSTRMALSAQRCLSFPEALEAGLTIVDLGNPPAGAERIARFWGGVLLGRLMRAVLSRPVHDTTPRTWIVFEEFQEILATRQGEQFGRLLALARSRRAAAWFLNQQPGQVDPNLVRLLRTNTAIEAIFRCNIEDARAVGHAIPVPRGLGQPREERQALLEELGRMARRAHYLWLKEMPFRAMQVRSPRLDLPALRSIADHVPADTIRRIRQGTIARPIVGIDEHVESIDTAPAAIDDDSWHFDEDGPEDDPMFPFLG
jgi:hypothetical protein